jgi:hypothetical protein
MVKVLDVFFDEKPRNEQSKRKIKKQHFGGGGGGFHAVLETYYVAKYFKYF